MLAGLKNLKILSLARNQISKIQKLDDVSGTLEELWISYNMIEKLDGLKNLKKLKKLYIGNNRIKRFDELNALVCMTVSRRRCCHTQHHLQCLTFPVIDCTTAPHCTTLHHTAPHH